MQKYSMTGRADELTSRWKKLIRDD